MSWAVRKQIQKERERERKDVDRKGRRNGRIRSRERGRKEERQKFGQSFVKEGGALKSPLENTGEFCLLVLHYIPSADFMGTNQNVRRKKRGK